MMPTSPSSPLKFRTVGFPQYGFKASLSDRACRNERLVEPMPGIPSLPWRLRRSFVRVRCGLLPGSESGTARPSTYRCAQGPYALLPQGSLARGRVLLSHPVIAYYDPIRRTRRHAVLSRPCRLYTAPSLCGHA